MRKRVGEGEATRSSERGDPAAAPGHRREPRADRLLLFFLVGLVVLSIVGVFALTAVRQRRESRERTRLAEAADRGPRILVASAIMAVVAWAIWVAIDRLVGRSLLGQIVSLGVAITAACVVYGSAVLAMRIPEARQIQAFVRSRVRLP